MTMKRFWEIGALPFVALGAFAVADACGGDDSTPPGPTNDGGTPDATVEAGIDATDGGVQPDVNLPIDGSQAATDAAVPVFLAHFSTSQLPEGIWARGDAGAPVVGLTQLASLVTVSTDGGTEPFGAIVEAGAASNSNALGIATDPGGNVYVGVGTLMPDAGVVPVPGVYKFPPTGGSGTLFSSTPAMNFPNGLTFIGTTLYVADSAGVIYTIDPAGTAAVWSSNALLAPNPAACNGMLPAAIGANGVVHDATNLYVTNSNYGRIVKIPIDADGGAGSASALVEDCALVGADGLTLDTKDNSLIVAINIQNKIVRVSQSGTIGVLASGAPLDFPASVVIDSVGGSRRLLITNAALFSGAMGQPGVLALPIP
jgi:sugar lactone lactonase YvrE